MPQDLRARVLEQEELGGGCFRMRLDAAPIAREARAGQFVMIGLPDPADTLVRRPFSVARLVPGAEEPEALEIVYKVYGRRTRQMARFRPGTEVALLGPLGRGFWLPGEGERTEVLLVAGGIGAAPFPLFLQRAGADLAGRTTLFLGGRGREDLLLVDWFREHCGEVILVTEDGSAGEPGLVTAPLAARLDAPPRGERVVLACGPRPMLRAVAELCLARDVPCQLSLEERMACGFGACLGCVVERRHPEGEFDRYVRVCTEGPVFDAREVLP